MSPQQFEQFGRFSPYIRVPSAGGVANNLSGDAFCEVLRHQTLSQVDQLLRMCGCKEIDDIPPAVRSISQENPQTLQTVENMLIAFRHFLTSSEHADVREKLGVVFQPMAAWVHGKYCITTPALLVIQSILHSHCEWFREELFESYSALRAYEELNLQGFHELHCRFVAAIIAHQTLLRAAWTTDDATDPREVWGIYDVYKDEKWVKEFAPDAEQPEVIGIALRRTLLRFVKDNVGQERLNLEQNAGDSIGLRSRSPESPDLLWRQLAAALVLHSLCLQCRHSRYGSELSRLPSEFKQQALAYLDHMLARERKQHYPGAGLVFFHYGRYANQVRKDSDSPSLFYYVKSMVAGALENDFERSISSETDCHRYNLSFCFERISHKRAWIDINWDSAKWPIQEIPENGVKLEASGLTLHRRKLDFGAGSQTVPAAGEAGSEKVKVAVIARLVADTVGFKLKDEDDAGVFTPVPLRECSLQICDKPLAFKLFVRPNEKEKSKKNAPRPAHYWKLELPPVRHLICPDPTGGNYREKPDLDTFRNKLDNWLRKDKGTLTSVVVADLLSILLGTTFVPQPNEKGKLSYIPTPVVGLVLRQLRELRPDAFTPLHLVVCGLGDEPRQQKQFTVWLPHLEPDLQGEPNNSADKIWSGSVDSSLHPKSAALLVARYVAAMVVGHAVSYAPKQILLDYYDDEHRKSWHGTIEKALNENGGPLMATYCTQLRVEPVSFRRVDPRSPATAGAELPNQKAIDDYFKDKNIIGIDIGGSSVRVVKFSAKEVEQIGQKPDSIKKKDLSVQLSRSTLESLKETVVSIVTGLIQESRTEDKEEQNKKNLQAFEKIESALTHAFREKISSFLGSVKTKTVEPGAWIDEKTIAIGVSLAAPVGKGSEVPLSTSGALYAYFGVDKRIAAVRLQDLHELDIGEALQKEKHREPPVIVRVINDGEADIFDSQTLDTGREEGIAVELKAGTGIAVAVRRDGKPWDLKAETAKAILDLAAEPNQDPPKNRFQNGVLGDYCSKNGLKRLTGHLFVEVQEVDNHVRNALQVGVDEEEFKETIKELYEDFKDNPGRFIGPLLDDVLYGPNDSPKPNDADKNVRTWLMTKCAESGGKISPSGETRQQFEEFCEKVRRIANLKATVDAESTADGDRRKWLQELTNEKPDPEDKDKEPKQSIIDEKIVWYKLSPEQKFAVQSAQRLGYWLADAIALAVDIFDAREVRLAGGPLSRATGIFVTAAAEQALEQLYGFDLEVIWDPRQDGGGQFEPLPIARHRVRQFRRLRLHYPPSAEGSDQSGARGAAKAAKQAWIESMRGRQLQKCRDWVQRKEVGATISASDVLAAVQNKSEEFSPLLIEVGDVNAMLAQESAALELTRTISLDFRKYPRHGELPDD